MKKLAIVDIDITLADGNHRDHYLQHPAGPDWKAYVAPEELAKDKLAPNADRVLSRLQDKGFDFVFLTGRSEHLRRVTVEWLAKYLGDGFANYSTDYTTNYWDKSTTTPTLRFEQSCSWKLRYPLIMRPAGNEVVPSEFKKDRLIDICMQHKPDILFAFDDDAYVWPVYERFGAFVFKAPECWGVLLPEKPADLPEEVAWRK